MDWWQWFLLVWLGGTVGFAVLLGIVVVVQRVLSWRADRSRAEAPEATIDLRDENESKAFRSTRRTDACTG